MATPFAAKSSNVRLNGGNTLVADEWNVQPRANRLDVANFEEPGGYENWILGLRGITVSVNGWVNADTQMFDSPLSLQDGQIITTNKFYLNTTSSPFWSLPIALVEAVGHNARVNQVFRYTVSILNKGAYVYPTGTFTVA